MDEQLSVIKIVAQPFSTAVFRGRARQSCQVLVDTVVLAALCVFLSCFEYYLASKVEGYALPHLQTQRALLSFAFHAQLNSRRFQTHQVPRKRRNCSCLVSIRSISLEMLLLM